MDNFTDDASPKAGVPTGEAKAARQVGVVERAVRSFKRAVRLMWLGSSLRGMLYRVTMRVAHRFNWHYAPIIGPMMSDDPTDWRNGKRQRWCTWCGMRDWVVEAKGPLEPASYFTCQPVTKATPPLKVGTPAQAESPGDEVQKGKP